MDDRNIGIFDSGVGGLTTLAEIEKELPNENIIYLGDTLNFPYGNKSKTEIVNLARKNIEILMNKNVKTIVIACGTVTSQALDIVKNEYDIPIIGIIEPTVKYVEKENFGKIGVIGTNGTIKSNAWENKIKEKNKDIKVISKSCPKLAEIAESGRANSIEGINAVKEYLQEIKEQKIDKIILGCTHYPLFIDVIKNELGYKCELINTGIMVAKELKNLLKEKELLNINRGRKVKIYLTKTSQIFKTNAENIFARNLDIETIRRYN